MTQPLAGSMPGALREAGIAYAVQNRLKKAAAFHIIDAEAEP